MSIKSYNPRSFLRPISSPPTGQLLYGDVILTPHFQPAAAPPPPHTAVHVVAFPTPPCVLSQLSYYHALPIYHQPTVVALLSSAYFHSAPPVTKVVGGVVEAMEPSARIYEIPTRKSAEIVHGVDAGRKWFSGRPRRKLEWRPKKSDGGAAVSRPPPPSHAKLTSEKTTVMIKNIPYQIRRDFMLEFLDSHSNAHSLEYDFLYLPMDFRKKDNLGYAFVNFTSGVAAQKFKEILQNYEWGTVETDKVSFTSNKICDITWARIQGKEGLVRRFQNSKFACDNMDFLPVVLDPPRNGSDPKIAPPVVLGRLQHMNIYDHVSFQR